MSVNTSITSAVVVLVVVMLIAGIAMGLALSGSDLVNPHRSKAQAKAMQQTAAIAADMQRAELEHYQAMSEIEQEAAQAAHQQEGAFIAEQNAQALAAQRRRDELELALLPLRELAFTAAGALAILAAGGGLAYYLVCLGRAAQARAGDPWQSPELRIAMRRIAQANERLAREAHPVVTVSAFGGNGRAREISENWR